MGHMLNNTIQDVLIRRARLLGKNACWVPGMDHASIATEAKVVAKLKEQGIDKNDLTREEFLAHAWEWKEKYGGIILEQLKKLGASCDWERTKFTMDPDMSEAVIKVFVDLYNKGLIYRGYRMVNWDPEAKTTLSDEEVIYEEKQGNLYYLQYDIEGSDEKVTIATTRPETILGDSAICINPNDERFAHLKGKKAIVPLCNRVIPIIEDEYVDIEFGTGCLKVTPAHDENDKVLGEKHNLEVIDILNEDASLNSFGLHYEGKDRFVVRKEISKELKEKGYLTKVEQHINKVGTSERTRAVIEPRLSDQWFLKMDELPKPAIDNVKNDEVEFFPKRFKNMYFNNWMNDVREWNISRQLWWGQQIPAYYFGDGKEDFVVAEDIETALRFAKEKTNNDGLTVKDLRQDSDVLDTWFSSWLWPMSVFDGIRNPENEEIKYYYPTNDLVTGWDIIFFWVARMIMSGYEYKGVKPFKNVYFTGMVRDKQGRKMSKQLGNSPNALKLIKDFGADAVRVGLLLSSAAGNDLMFDEALCQQGKGLTDKVWSGYYLTTLWETSETIEQPETAKTGLQWYKSKFQQTLAEIEDHYSKYRLSDAIMAIYKLLKDDFSGWLLEVVKPVYQQPIDIKTYNEVMEVFEDNLKILHPFMPFLTEEVWHLIKERTSDEALIISKYPEQTSFDSELITNFEFVTGVVSGLRTVRKEKNIVFKEAIEVSVMNNEGFTNEFNSVIQKLTNTSTITEVSEKVEGAAFRVKANEYFVPISIEDIDVEAEIKKLTAELKRAQGFLFGIQKKLSNERFVNNAPEQVITLERKKESDTLAKIETIKSSLESLK
jgi:valyl-tRNA synthetase